MAEITGTVMLGYDHAPKERKICICCPDFPAHVYTVALDLPEYPTQYPKHFGRDLDLWVKSNFDFKKLEGCKIKITAELL